MSEETRQKLLTAGIQLLHERYVPPCVEHISLAAVARRAGCSTGVAYRIWPTQVDFRHDLATAAITRRDRSSIADMVHHVRDLVEAHAPLLEVIRRGGERHVEDRVALREVVTLLALRTTSAGDEEATSAARARVAEGIAEHANLYSILMPIYQLQMRPPFTVVQLAHAIAAVAEGFVLLDADPLSHPVVVRDGLGDGVGSEWTILATTVQALFEFFTEPCSPSADGRGQRAASSASVQNPALATAP